MLPHKIREATLQALYSLQQRSSTDDSSQDPECDTSPLLALLAEELMLAKRHVKEAISLAREVWSRREELDAAISEFSISYSFSRIQSVEKAILRLATHDILHRNTLSPEVAISDALRLTRKFSNPAASSFVNAILDAIYRKKEGKEADLALLEQASLDLATYDRLSEQAATSPLPIPSDEDERTTDGEIDENSSLPSSD